MRRVLIAVIALAVAAPAAADCICECVNGHMRPICSSAIDLPPICPPAVCPLAPPSIPPIQPPVIPPVGTTECRQKRVCDLYGNCVWRTICE